MTPERKCAREKQTTRGNNPENTKLDLTFEEIYNQVHPTLGLNYRIQLEAKLKSRIQ